MTTTERWVVRCDDYTKPTTYKTEADAVRAIEALEELGACHLPHEAVVACHHEARTFVGPGGIPGTDRTTCGKCGVALDPGFA